MSLILEILCVLMCLQADYYNDIYTKTRFKNKKVYASIAMDLILAIVVLCCIMIVFTDGAWADAAITAGVCSIILKVKNN